MTTLNAHDYTAGEVITASTLDGLTADLNTLLTEIEGSCYVETGTYTGDGGVGKDVSLTDTELIVQAIWIFVEAADGGTTASYITSDEFADNDADGLMITERTGLVADNSTRLGTAGKFTVDDQGADNHPNKNGTVYHYVVFGTH